MLESPIGSHGLFCKVPGICRVRVTAQGVRVQTPEEEGQLFPEVISRVLGLRTDLGASSGSQFGSLDPEVCMRLFSGEALHDKYASLHIHHPKNQQPNFHSHLFCSMRASLKKIVPNGATKLNRPWEDSTKRRQCMAYA